MPTTTEAVCFEQHNNTVHYTNNKQQQATHSMDLLAPTACLCHLPTAAPTQRSLYIRWIAKAAAAACIYNLLLSLPDALLQEKHSTQAIPTG